jgi:microcystin-dependent protein
VRFRPRRGGVSQRLTYASAGVPVTNNFFEYDPLFEIADFFAAVANTLVNVYPQIALSQDGSTFGDWMNYQAGHYKARKFKARAVVHTNDPTTVAFLTAFSFALYVPTRVDNWAGQVNTALLAIATQHSGASSPVNGPGGAPSQFQVWMDTTNASFPVLRIYDGAAWRRTGRLDIANGSWCAQLGGGTSSVASAASIDLGNIPGGFVTITGTATIGTFGAAAHNGEIKRCYAGGAFTLTHSANIVCPGGESILADVGDTFDAVYLGSGAWLIWGYQRARGAAGTQLQTGDTIWRYSTGARTGAVRANAGTIGNTGSGATEFAGPQAWRLFELIWNGSTSDPEVVISGGRGASAVADWAAAKTISLPDLRGRVPAGIDSSGTRLTSATMSPNGNTLGAVGGSQQVTLTAAQIPAHNHTASSTSTVGDPGHVHSELFFNTGAGSSPYSGPATTNGSNQVTNTGLAFTGISVSTSTTVNNSTGGGGAHSNVQPTKLGTWYIAL